MQLSCRRLPVGGYRPGASGTLPLLLRISKGELSFRRHKFKQPISPRPSSEIGFRTTQNRNALTMPVPPASADIMLPTRLSELVADRTKRLGTPSECR